MTIDQENSAHGSCRIRVDDHGDQDGFSIKNLDRLDKLAVVAIIIIVAFGTVIIALNAGQEGSSVGSSRISRQAVVIISPEFDNKLALANSLLNNENLPKARELIDDMIKNYPYDGRPYMLLGDLYVHQQQPVLAMLEYRKGVDLNPDFLDKKAKKLFRGKHLKNILDEARSVISAGLEKNPADPQLKQQMGTLYYMLRRVAGSCG